MTSTALCDDCFHNIKPEELPLDYLPKPLCEQGVSGYPFKTACMHYSKDGLHDDSANED